MSRDYTRGRWTSASDRPYSPPCIFVRTPFETFDCFEEGNFPGRETELMASLLAKPRRSAQLVRR